MAVSSQHRSSAVHPPKTPRHDVLALWGGVLFSALFTGLIWWAGRFISIDFLSDQGVSWYYWKLPEPTVWSRLSVWSMYLAHQIAVFWLIYYAQKHVKRYTTGLHPVNLWALGINALFILLHFVQTHLWYDGLAQDVSIFSSQGSVIVLLVWILLMENPRRGLFLGKKLPLSKDVTHFARKYHGYFFAWAIIYTFWYHPAEATSGHLVGFFYTFLLMLQGSLFFTRIHLNRWWTFTQEFLVLIHGTMVAVMNANDLWQMFFFGFAGIFVITQMHGLGLSRLTRSVLFLAYAAGVFIVYSARRWEHIEEIFRIPLIDYLAVLILAGIFWLGLSTARFIKKRTQQPAQG